MQSGNFTAASILCCICSIQIEAGATAFCSSCLQSRVDITEGIPKQITIFWCRNCGRYQRPPWVVAELESKEMLALCLKKIKGLNKEAKLVDAAFIWTEPHSRRIKVKLTVQKEVFNGIVMQQTFVVEFIVANQQCTDCQASFTEHTWEACVQLRQHRKHKRTMFMLEQMLIKHSVTPDVMQIKQVSEGLDFYFKTASQAKKLIDFAKTSLPIRLNYGKKLVSEDLNSNTHKHKYSTMIEIAPCCKDDIVLVSKQLANSIGCPSNVFLCYKVNSTLHLLDPVSLKTIELSSERYWADPPRVLLSHDRMVEYVVIDIEVGQDQEYYQNTHSNTNLTAFNKQTNFNSKMVQAEVTIARVADFGNNDTQFTVMTHLGHLLQPGDTVLGYDIIQHNLGDDAYNKRGDLPDAILVRKTLHKIKKRSERRKWKLKRLGIVDEGEKVLKKAQIEQSQVEFEEFMEEIEEDPQMLSTVNIYSRFTTKAEEDEHHTRFGHLAGEDGEDDLPDLLEAMVLHDAQISIETAPKVKPVDRNDEDEDDEPFMDDSGPKVSVKSGRGLHNQKSGAQLRAGGFDTDNAQEAYQVKNLSDIQQE
jgi:nonsense-mediated mRNA decay protein 3